MANRADNLQKCGIGKCDPRVARDCYSANEPKLSTCKKCLCYTCTRGACKPADDYHKS